MSSGYPTQHDDEQQKGCEGCHEECGQTRMDMGEPPCALFVGSGAWQRMTEHFETQPRQPLHVKDLAREIELIEEWYEKRFHEMDAFFGIEDGVEIITMPESSRNAVYDLLGRKVETSVLAPGLYISNGKIIAK